MKKAKKGFTLAELLIVVAIIAVLTAIAVPLFVGSVTDAQNNTKEANKRAVRATAVVAILQDTNHTTYGADAGHGWLVDATISASGDITSMTIKPATGTGETDYTTEGSISDSAPYTVKMLITELKPTKG